MVNRLQKLHRQLLYFWLFWITVTVFPGRPWMKIKFNSINRLRFGGKGSWERSFPTHLVQNEMLHTPLVHQIKYEKKGILGRERYHNKENISNINQTATYLHRHFLHLISQAFLLFYLSITLHESTQFSLESRVPYTGWYFHCTKHSGSDFCWARSFALLLRCSFQRNINQKNPAKGPKPSIKVQSSEKNSLFYEQDFQI